LSLQYLHEFNLHSSVHIFWPMGPWAELSFWKDY
jgi:hypothetical protein